MALRRVVVPVDFSADSRSASRLALALAAKDRASVRLVHVDTLRDAPLPPGEGERLWYAVEAHQVRRLELEVQSLRVELQRRGSTEVELSATLRRGDPAEEICVFAAEWGADLLVLGAHGGPGSVRYLLGSISARVAREAPCPVLVTRPGRSEELGQGGRFHRALVAVDHSQFSLPCVRAAAELLHPTGALEVLHVWQPPASEVAGPGLLEASQAHLETEARALDALVSECRTGAVELTNRVTSGNPPQEILAEAERFPADVIVMGSHGRHGLFEHVTGTVADRVLRHAGVAVLLVPQRALRARQSDGLERGAPRAAG